MLFFIVMVPVTICVCIATFLGFLDDRQSRAVKPPLKQPYWPRIYEMERAIYGHTFTHLGAPADKVVVDRPRPKPAVPAGAYEHIKAQDPQWIMVMIEEADQVEQVVRISGMARKEVEILLDNADQQGRMSLTYSEDRICEAYEKIYAACNRKIQTLERRAKV